MTNRCGILSIIFFRYSVGILFHSSYSLCFNISLEVIAAVLIRRFSLSHKFSIGFRSEDWDGDCNSFADNYTVNIPVQHVPYAWDHYLGNT